MKTSPRQLGTRTETFVVRTAQDHGLMAERLAEGAAYDRGDVRIYTDTEWVLEVKDRERLNLHQALSKALTKSGTPDTAVVWRRMTRGASNTRRRQDGLVVHHMGHVGERSRGDSRLRDWPDVEWRLVRANEEPDSTRFISAYGRDVEQFEGQLVHDPQTRHLSYVGGDRKDAEAREALPDVVEILIESEYPLSQRAIWDIARDRTDHSRAIVERALKVGRRDHVVHLVPGPRNSKLHHHMTQCPSVPQCPGSFPGTVNVSAPVSYRTGAHTDGTGTLLQSDFPTGHSDPTPEDIAP